MDNPDLDVLTGKHLLIVDDDSLTALFLEELFTGKGLIVHHVEDGLLAVEYCSNQPVHVILMDIQLPSMTGFEATSIIKKDKPNIRIIAQTSCALPEDRLTASEAGCDSYINKPYGIMEILKLVQEQLSLQALVISC